MLSPFSGVISSSTDSRPMQGIAPAGNFPPAAILLARAIARGAGNVWPVVLAGHDIPRVCVSGAVVMQSFEFHEHGAAVAEHGLHPAAEREQDACERQRALQSPISHQHRQPLDDLVTRSAGESGVKADGLHARITLRQQIEIGYVAAADPPYAHGLREFMLLRVEPAVHVDPRAILQRTERLAAIAQDRANRRESRNERPGRDSDANGVEAFELAAVLVDDRGGERRQRAHAADDRDSRRARFRIQLRDATDESAAIGEIEIVAACLDRRARHCVALTLERARGVDHGIDAELAQLQREVRAGGIERAGVIRVEAELIGQGGGLGLIATGQNQPDARVLRQRRADAGAKESICAEYE